MKRETKQLLDHSLDMALAHGYTLNKYFCVVERCGDFMPAEMESPSCHPLESVIVGQKVSNYLNFQVAESLNVTPQWVDGFVDAYSDGEPDPRYLTLDRNHPDYKGYSEGFQDGLEYQDTIAELESAYSQLATNPPF